MPSLRFVGLCLGLFAASALISIEIRSSYGHKTWHTLFQSKEQSAVTETYSRVAFATFLAGSAKDDSHPGRKISEDIRESRDEAEDGYYLGARVLAYNLLHNPKTRTNNSIPFLVLVTPDVRESKRARLEADGAKVIVAEKLNADWVHPGAPRWRDVLAKLRLFQLTNYKKICFIDADMLVTDQLDGVFNDPATDLRRTLDEPSVVHDDEASLPLTYMFAGKGDAFSYDHPIPPKPSDYLNSGFFVFTPSHQLFDYYVSLLNIPDRFDPSFPEQNLLNYAHRKDGNMPWTYLSWRWNMNWPTIKDFELGARSFHAKYWDGDPTHDKALKRKWEAQRDEMRGYYRGVHDALSNSFSPRR